MNTSFERPEEDLGVIEIELSKKEWTNALEAAQEALKSDDQNQIREFAIQNEVNRALNEIVAQENLKLVTQPTVLSSAQEDGGMIISINCELIPEITLGAYKGLNIAVEQPAVTEEEIAQEITRQIASRQTWEVMPSDYAAKNGDRVIIDYLGEKDGVPFEGGAAQKYPLVLGSQSFIPGFEDQLIGIKAGESRDVKLSFPENYFEPSLAGAAVVFHVTCHAVETEIKPELTDAFIEKLEVDGIRTVEQLKQRVKAEMLNIKQQEAEAKAISELLEKIIDASEVKVPDAIVKQQINQRVAQYESSLAQYGMNLDAYLQMTNQSLQQLEEEVKPLAIRDVQAAMILEAVAESENITVEQEDLQQEYDLLSRVYGMPPQQLQAFLPPASVAASVQQRKTIDLLKKENFVQA